MGKSLIRKVYSILGIEDMPKVKRWVKSLYKSYFDTQCAVYKELYKISPDFVVKHASGLMIHGGGQFMDTAAKYMPYYLSDADLSDFEKIFEMKKDMLSCYFLYGINPEEYLIHAFDKKTKDLRERYVSKKVKDESIASQLGVYREKAFVELKDKYLFYELAPQYFKRDVCKLSGKGDFEPFADFVKKHPRFIAKPVSGRYGAGTCILNLSDFGNNIESMFEKLLKDNRWIIEELINQDERMGVWNESSVNTVRIPSFRTKDGIKIMRPFIRMGRKGCVVDNAGNGGIFFSIDAQTGAINTLARDERGNRYESNPDNGMPFRDWCVPEWESLLELSREVHKSLPAYHKYVGFDFALSKDKGWQLVEGNWGDFICQQSTLGFGVKEEFMELLYG